MYTKFLKEYISAMKKNKLFSPDETKQDMEMEFYIFIHKRIKNFGNRYKLSTHDVEPILNNPDFIKEWKNIMKYLKKPFDFNENPNEKLSREFDHFLKTGSIKKNKS